MTGSWSARRGQDRGQDPQGKGGGSYDDSNPASPLLLEKAVLALNKNLKSLDKSLATDRDQDNLSDLRRSEGRSDHHVKGGQQKHEKRERGDRDRDRASHSRESREIPRSKSVGRQGAGGRKQDALSMAISRIEGALDRVKIEVEERRKLGPDYKRDTPRGRDRDSNDRGRNKRDRYRAGRGSNDNDSSGSSSRSSSSSRRRSRRARTSRDSSSSSSRGARSSNDSSTGSSRPRGEKENNKSKVLPRRVSFLIGDQNVLNEMLTKIEGYKSEKKRPHPQVEGSLESVSAKSILHNALVSPKKKGRNLSPTKRRLPIAHSQSQDSDQTVSQVKGSQAISLTPQPDTRFLAGTPQKSRSVTTTPEHIPRRTGSPSSETSPSVPGKKLLSVSSAFTRPLSMISPMNSFRSLMTSARGQQDGSKRETKSLAPAPVVPVVPIVPHDPHVMSRHDDNEGEKFA